MAGRATFSATDFDSEVGTTSIHTEDPTAANYAQLQTDVNALRTAMDAIMVHNFGKSELTDILWNNVSAATSPLAQREVKWLVTVVDVSGTKYAAMEIPLADISILENGSKYIIKASQVTVTAAAAAVTAFKTAFEAVATDRFGQTLVIWDVEQVGRNS